ncbi:hypothetical protein ACFZAT_20735 [Streptomyces sp. NPDC008163]
MMLHVLDHPLFTMMAVMAGLLLPTAQPQRLETRGPLSRPGLFP